MAKQRLQSKLKQGFESVPASKKICGSLFWQCLADKFINCRSESDGKGCVEINSMVWFFVVYKATNDIPRIMSFLANTVSAMEKYQSNRSFYKRL